MRTRFRTPEITIKRNMEYNGYNIAKMNDESFRIIYPDRHWLPIRDIEHGKKSIDLMNASETTIILRPTRTTHHKPVSKEFPKAGYQKYPPDHCRFKVTFDNSPTTYVDNINCAFNCKDLDCKTHQELTEGRSLRLRRLNYKLLNKVCPYCDSEISRKEDDKWFYECGTIGDRYSEIYIKHCGKSNKPQRTRR